MITLDFEDFGPISTIFGYFLTKFPSWRLSSTLKQHENHTGISVSTIDNIFYLFGMSQDNQRVIMVDFGDLRAILGKFRQFLTNF